MARILEVLGRKIVEQASLEKELSNGVWRERESQPRESRVCNDVESINCCSLLTTMNRSGIYPFSDSTVHIPADSALLPVVCRGRFEASLAVVSRICRVLFLGSSFSCREQIPSSCCIPSFGASPVFLYLH